MNETLHPRRVLLGGRSGPPDPLDSQDSPGETAYVFGATGWPEELPVAGMTVGRIRQLLADRLNIDAAARPMINSQYVGADVVLGPGERLYFHRDAGEKGVHGLRAVAADAADWQHTDVHSAA